ncbi:EfeM/EfeO family lipoprotein [Streptomyces sp. HNM0575]|nr:EfeM/EfeO family lipoprotein [Streptomyces sp. HNM0575]
MPLSRRALVGVCGAAAVAVAAVSASWWPGDRPHDGAVAAADGLPHTGVEVSGGKCGRGWDHARPGIQVFELHNGSDRAAEVYLRDARSGAAYGEVDGIGPGTTRTLRADLGDGTYSFACFPDDGAPAVGPKVRVHGGRGGHGGPAARPVDQHDLIPPTLSYQHWIAGRMGPLLDATEKLRSAIDDGDLARAREAWLPAHLTYERMGAAYGTFDDADGAINGTTASLPGGVHDKDFTGFHRIEHGLWHGESASSLRPFADRLVEDVRTLRKDWSQARMDPLDLGLRAHEILENTVQFELTGRTDYGSHSNLATARANLDGTRVALSRLRPLLASRYPRMGRLDDELDGMQARLDGHEHDGHWTPLGELGRMEREKVNADASELVERLADIAALCDVRRTR